MTTSDHRDPRTYELKKSAIDVVTVSTFFDAYYPEMRRIAAALSSLGVLPLMEEPKGSGILATTGNYSMRTIDGFFITGSSVDKCNIQRDGLVYVEKIDYDTGSMTIAGNVKPSREVLIHDQIYSAFPEVNVVLHTHDELALRYDTSSPRTKNPIFFATLGEARQVVDALHELNYVTLPEHGQFAVGKDVDNALDEVINHHHDAKSRTPMERIVRAGIGLSYAAAGTLLISGVLAEIAFECRAEQKQLNPDGTATYVLSKLCNEKSIHAWEGEGQVLRPDGKHEVTFWVGGQ